MHIRLQTKINIISLWSWEIFSITRLHGQRGRFTPPAAHDSGRRKFSYFTAWFGTSEASNLIELYIWPALLEIDALDISVPSTALGTDISKERNTNIYVYALVVLNSYLALILSIASAGLHECMVHSQASTYVLRTRSTVRVRTNLQLAAACKPPYLVGRPGDR